jgi:hypothetical protein
MSADAMAVGKVGMLDIGMVDQMGAKMAASWESMLAAAKVCGMEYLLAEKKVHKTVALMAAASADWKDTM